jgi:hypothetical protein
VSKSGGEIENYTTSDCWGDNVTMTIEAGGIFDTKSSTTIFPAALTNNGTVRYSREAETLDQTIVDMDYYRLEISLDPDNYKNWALGANRTIADSLKINYDANLVLTAASPVTLTVGNMLHLSSGVVNNSDANVSLTLSDGVLIKRVTGSLTAAPVFAGMVDVIYASTSTNVTTGPELPAATGVLNDLELTGDEGVTLGADVTVNGTCAATGSDIFTGSYVLTLGPAATLVENADRTVIGTVTATRTASQGVNETFGNIGVEIEAAGAAPGVTTVTRTTGTALDINGTPGILRSFDVSPAVNSGLDATVVFRYDESELNGIDEGDLAVYAGSVGSWTKLASTLDPTGNRVTVTGVDAFETITLGAESSTGVDDGGTPAVTRLASIYPNPFNPSTRIVFDLREKTAIYIAVYDIGGRLVCTLKDGVLDAGRHEMTWRGVSDSGASVSSGVYFCRMGANGTLQTFKIVLLR